MNETRADRLADLALVSEHLRMDAYLDTCPGHRTKVSDKAFVGCVVRCSACGRHGAIVALVRS